MLPATDWLSLSHGDPEHGCTSGWQAQAQCSMECSGTAESLVVQWQSFSYSVHVVYTCMCVHVHVCVCVCVRVCVCVCVHGHECVQKMCICTQIGMKIVQIIKSTDVQTLGTMSLKCSNIRIENTVASCIG